MSAPAFVPPVSTVSAATSVVNAPTSTKIARYVGEVLVAGQHRVERPLAEHLAEVVFPLLQPVGRVRQDAITFDSGSDTNNCESSRQPVEESASRRRRHPGWLLRFGPDPSTGRVAEGNVFVLHAVCGSRSHASSTRSRIHLK